MTCESWAIESLNSFFVLPGCLVMSFLATAGVICSLIKAGEVSIVQRLSQRSSDFEGSSLLTRISTTSLRLLDCEPPMVRVLAYEDRTMDAGVCSIS